MANRERQSWRWAQPDWGDEAYQSARSELVGYLDEVRAETVQWRAALATVRASAAGKVGAGQLPIAIGSAVAPDTSSIAANIVGLVGMHPMLRERFEGNAAQLRRILDQLGAAWPTVADTPAVALDGATTAQRLAETVAVRCAEITTPVWANRELAEMTTGQVLDFKSEYGEGLPNADARQRLLTELAARSKSVPALVDPEQEALYCTPSGTLVELWFTAAPFLALIVFGVIAVLIGNARSWWSSNLTDSFPDQWNDSGTLLGGYVAAAAGGIAHLYVDWFKTKRLVGGSELVVPRRFRQRIEVYAPHLCGSVAVVFVVSLVWIWVADRTDAATMVLVGYSADSLLSAFVARFTAFAPGAGAALVKQVG
jgi:hypothetical protein